MTTIVYPSKDSVTLEASPTTNYGTSTQLYIDERDVGDNRHTFLDFDLSSINEYEHVSSNLSLQPFITGSILDVGYSYVTTSWTEGGITWNNEPSYSAYPPDKIRIQCTSPYPRTTENVSDYVHVVSNGSSTYYGFALHTSTIVSGTVNTAGIYSKEYTLDNRPYIEVTTFEDEGYYVSGSVSIPLFGAYICGNGEGDMSNYNTTSGDVIVGFQLPWADTYGSYETYSYNDTNSWSTAGSGYTEYFNVEYDSLFLVDGEYYVAIFNYEWYRQYDDVYVTTTGSDSNTGTSWADAFRTVTKGFDSVSLDGTVNVEGGTYTGESSFEVKRDCKMELRSGYGNVILNIN